MINKFAYCSIFLLIAVQLSAAPNPPPNRSDPMMSPALSEETNPAVVKFFKNIKNIKNIKGPKTLQALDEFLTNHAMAPALDEKSRQEAFQVAETVYRILKDPTTKGIEDTLASLLGALKKYPILQQQVADIVALYVDAFDGLQVYLQNAKEKPFSEESLQKLQSTRDRLAMSILAFENDIPYPILQRNPDLKQFLATNNIGPWVKWLGVNHPVKVETGSEGQDHIMIRYGDDWHDWNTVKATLQQGHVFVEKGFISGGVSDQINPLRKIKEPDGKYYYEEAFFALPNHRWIRLTDADGTLYSIGWLSKGSLSQPSALHSWGRYLFSRAIAPTATSSGLFVSPDPAELVPNNLIQSTVREITKGQFDQLMTLLQAYQANPPACPEDNAQACNSSHFVAKVRESVQWPSDVSPPEFVNEQAHPPTNGAPASVPDVRTDEDNLSPADTAIMADMLASLAQDSMWTLASKRTEFTEQGKSIKHVSPLKYLAAVASNPQMKENARTVRGRSMIWPTLNAVLTKALDKAYAKGKITEPQISEFASDANLDHAKVAELIKEKQWDKLIDDLLAN